MARPETPSSRRPTRDADDAAVTGTRRPAAARLAGEVRRLHQAANLSQSELANRIGYSPAYVSLAERDSKGLPPAALVEAIDRALGAAGELVALRRLAEAEQRAQRGDTEAAGRGDRAVLTVTIRVPPSAEGTPDLAGLWRELARQATRLATTLDTDAVGAESVSDAVLPVR